MEMHWVLFTISTEITSLSFRQKWDFPEVRNIKKFDAASILGRFPCFTTFANGVRRGVATLYLVCFETKCRSNYREKEGISPKKGSRLIALFDTRLIFDPWEVRGWEVRDQIFTISRIFKIKIHVQKRLPNRSEMKLPLACILFDFEQNDVILIEYLRCITC